MRSTVACFDVATASRRAGVRPAQFAPDFPVLLIGSALTGLALGVFSSVDQALVLNVLPEKDTDAGRFLGINGYSTSIAQAVAPLLAAPLIVIGVSGADKNYGLLFIVASVLTVVAGILVQWRVKSVC